MDHRDEFLVHLRARGYAAGTLGHKARHLDAFFDFLARRKIHDPAAVTPRHIADYRAFVLRAKSARFRKKFAQSQIEARLIVVKQYFARLVKRKKIILNPAHNLTWPKQPYALPKLILTEKDVEALMAGPDLSTSPGLRDRAMLEVLYSTAIRRGELANLNVYDIDLAGGLLRVRHGKGGKARTVPLGATAGHFLERYLRIRNRRPRAPGRPLEAALFLTKFGGRFKPESLNHILHKYLQAVYPGRDLACHALRHACATHMLRGGAHIRYIQELLGHSKLETTQIYTQLCPLDLKEAHRRHHPHGQEP